VTDAEAITSPYGLGIAKDNVYFVRYVNACWSDCEPTVGGPDLQPLAGRDLARHQTAAVYGRR
jgi:hypothetical protein